MKRKDNPSSESRYSHLSSPSGHEDNSPLVLVSLGWERLPNGIDQLRLECNTLVDYVSMPSGLVYGHFILLKAGWDEEGKAALYREDNSARRNDPGE